MLITSLTRSTFLQRTRDRKKSALDRVDAEIRRSANECVAYNADRDRLKVKHARVPSGSETCQFCIMLASRGAVYKSKETASHAHANCDCKVVPDFGDGIEGYDPDLYYDMWKHPEIYEEKSVNISSENEEKFLSKEQDVLFGVKRGNAMTFEEADGKRVNPHYNDGIAYQINCQSCVVAYEARRRGFDVEVLPYNKNGKSKELANRTELAWFIKGTHDIPLPIRDESSLTPKRFKKLLEDTVKQNERYHLGFDFVKGGGHIVTVERDINGELMIYDPQNGNIRKGKEIDSYLKEFKFRYTLYGKKIPNPPDLLRVDNLDFNKEYAGAVVKEAIV